MSETSTLISCTGKITRAELAQIPTPPSTATSTTHLKTGPIQMTAERVVRTMHRFDKAHNAPKFDRQKIWPKSIAPAGHFVYTFATESGALSGNSISPRVCYCQLGFERSN